MNMSSSKATTSTNARRNITIKSCPRSNHSGFKEYTKQDSSTTLTTTLTSSTELSHASLLQDNRQSSPKNADEPTVTIILREQDEISQYFGAALLSLTESFEKKNESKAHGLTKAQRWRNAILAMMNKHRKNTEKVSQMLGPDTTKENSTGEEKPGHSNPKEQVQEENQLMDAYTTGTHERKRIRLSSPTPPPTRPQQPPPRRIGKKDLAACRRAMERHNTKIQQFFKTGPPRVIEIPSRVDMTNGNNQVDDSI